MKFKNTVFLVNLALEVLESEPLSTQLQLWLQKGQLKFKLIWRTLFLAMEVLESDLRQLHGAVLEQFLSLSFKSPLTVTRIPNMRILKIHKE